MTYRDVLLAVTSADATDIQENVFFWKDGRNSTNFIDVLFLFKMLFKMYLLFLLCVGDPCPQPAQLEASMLYPCTNATKLNYFDGSKAGFGIFIIVLFLFPVGKCFTVSILYLNNFPSQIM